MSRSPQDVAQSHLAAVVAGDPVAMAADYAADAVLVRLDDTYRGRQAIQAYFATVPSRLGEAKVIFDSIEIDNDRVTFSWHLDGGPTNASGTDVCTVSDGLITHQVVTLDADDF